MTASPGAAYRGLRRLCGAQLNAGRLDTAGFEQLLLAAGYTAHDASKHAAQRLRGGTVALQALVPDLARYPKLHAKVKCLALANEDAEAAECEGLRSVYHKHAAGDGRLYVNGLEKLLAEPNLPLPLAEADRTAAAKAAEELMCELMGSEAAVSCGFAEFLELTRDACNLVAHASERHVRAGKKAKAQVTDQANALANAQAKAASRLDASPSGSPVPSPQPLVPAPPQCPGGQPSRDDAGPAAASNAEQVVTACEPESQRLAQPQPMVFEAKSDAECVAQCVAAPTPPAVSAGATEGGARKVPPKSAAAPIVKEPSPLSHRMLPSGRPAQLRLEKPHESTAEVTPPPPPAPVSSPASTQSHPPPQHSRQLLSAGRARTSSGASKLRPRSARASANDSPRQVRSQRGTSPPETLSRYQFADREIPTQSTAVDPAPLQSASSLNAQLPCPKLQREAVPTPSPSPLPVRDALSGKGSSTPPVTEAVHCAEQPLQHSGAAAELPPRLHVPSPIAEAPITPGTPRHRPSGVDMRDAAPSPAMSFRDPNAGEPEVMRAARDAVPLPQAATPAAELPADTPAAAAQIERVAGAAAATNRPNAASSPTPTQLAASSTVADSAPAPSDRKTHAEAHAAAAPKPGLVTSAFQLVVGAAIRAAGLQPMAKPPPPPALPEPPKSSASAPATDA